MYYAIEFLGISHSFHSFSINAEYPLNVYICSTNTSWTSWFAPGLSLPFWLSAHIPLLFFLLPQETRYGAQLCAGGVRNKWNLHAFTCTWAESLGRRLTLGCYSIHCQVTAGQVTSDFLLKLFKHLRFNLHTVTFIHPPHSIFASRSPSYPHFLISTSR
jgi:hypothetical protein